MAQTALGRPMARGEGVKRPHGYVTFLPQVDYLASVHNEVDLQRGPETNISKMHAPECSVMGHVFLNGLKQVGGVPCQNHCPAAVKEGNQRGIKCV